MGTGRSSGTFCNGCVDTVLAACQVWFAPAGVRIRQWPARLASRAFPGSGPGRPQATYSSTQVDHGTLRTARSDVGPASSDGTGIGIDSSRIVGLARRSQSWRKTRS